MPRNKILPMGDGTSYQRFNQFVKDSDMGSSRRVVLATEWHKVWQAGAVGIDEGIPPRQQFARENEVEESPLDHAARTRDPG